ncbi:hypothetical protein Y032_0020g130 [Ancylostoma ceylanicum]|uniref:SCP domain-containing protein n=1 Tax=Ancylostoma ceylanicum TaxID=53326 RepID=A0A016UZR4_9BILA|nr:hypothetical protein Y032_0020g130 [Ancylostoma ceylanicum]
MSSLTRLIAIACCLLSVVSSASVSTPDVPDCLKTSKKNYMAIPNHLIRQMMFTDVVAAKGQNSDLKYSCEMEELAYDLVNESGPIDHVDPDNIVFSMGNGKLNLKTAVDLWQDRLKEMGEKKEFGCNFAIGSTHKVACIFKYVTANHLTSAYPDLGTPPTAPLRYSRTGYATGLRKCPEASFVFQELLI